MPKANHSTKPLKRKRLKPTAERVRELLHYDPETGIFRWRVNHKNAKAGSIAGYLRGGYRYIKINFRHYKAASLAWCHQTGQWPSKGMEVDHRDLNRSNDRWDNLRIATKSQNGCNRAKSSRNTTGFKGVTFNKNSQKFRAYIYVPGKEIHLGYFDTAIRAFWAVRRARNKLHGEFARNY